MKKIDSVSPSFKSYGNAEQEAVSTVLAIQKLIADGMPLKEIAILGRKRDDFKLIKKWLTINEVPFQFSAGKEDFLETRNGTAVFNILQFVRLETEHPIDSTGFLAQFLLSRTNSKEFIENFLLMKKNGTKSLYNHLKEKYNNNSNWQVLFNNLDLLLKGLNSEIDREKIAAIEKAINWEIPKSIANHKLNSWNSFIIEFLETDKEKTTASLCEQLWYQNQMKLPIRIESGDSEEKSDGIILSTIHSSKGLEFECVFAIASNNKNWESKGNSGGYSVPKFLSEFICIEADSDDDMKRLIYVASTRAKSYLNISSYRKTDSEKDLSISKLFESFVTSKNCKFEEVTSFELPEIKSTQYQLNGSESLMLLIKECINKFEISPSSLHPIEECQNKFLYTQILKLQTPGAEALSFGSMIHDVLNAYAANLDNYKKGEELEILIEECYRKHSHWFCKNRGPKYLKFAKWLIPDYLQKYPITETSFSLEETYHGEFENNIKIKGQLDRVEKSLSVIKVVDYKSGKTLPNSKPFVDEANTGSQYWKQATIYTKLMMQNFKDAETYKFEFHYLEQDKTVIPFVYEKNEEFENWLGKLYSDIKQMNFQEQCLNPDCIYCKNKIS